MKTRVLYLLAFVALASPPLFRSAAQKAGTPSTDPRQKQEWVDKFKPYTLRVHAIALSDSRGARAAVITREQVRQWVDKANEIFKQSGAGLQLSFNTNRFDDDYEEMRSTALNNLDSGGTGWKEANEIAAKHPHEIVYFFRWGGGATPTGNGFSFPPQSGKVCNFVALPGFNNTSVISDGEASVQNIWQLAHDTGHYLGLPHTFPGYSGVDTNDWDDVKNVAAAGETADYIRNNGGTALALDGDHIFDTPAEAGASYYRHKGWKMCSEHESYTVAGTKADGTAFSYTFKPARHNVMSYFACEPMGFTAGQVNRMRETLQLPARSQLLQ